MAKERGAVLNFLVPFSMSFSVVFPPYFDGLVCLAGNKAQACSVKGGCINACLGIEGSRLYLRLDLLKTRPAAPVIKGQEAVIRPRDHYVVFVDGKRVNNTLGLACRGEVVQKASIRTLELFDAV